MLIRMVSSSQLATGTTLLPFISLIIGTLLQPCPSCQPNYLLLGLIVSYTMLAGLGSVLIHPKSTSTDDDILMQVSAPTSVQPGQPGLYRQAVAGGWHVCLDVSPLAIGLGSPAVGEHPLLTNVSHQHHVGLTSN